MKVKGTTISMVRGDSESFTVRRVKKIDEEEILIPFVPGDIVYFTVKERIGRPVKALQKVTTQFEDGTAIVRIDPLDTKAMKFKEYHYDIQLTHASGAVTTLVSDSIFEIEGEVTDE